MAVNFTLNRFHVRRWLNIQISITNTIQIYGIQERLKLGIKVSNKDAKQAGAQGQKQATVSDSSVHKHPLDTPGLGHFMDRLVDEGFSTQCCWVRRVMAVSGCLVHCGILGVSLAFIQQMPAVATKNVSRHFQMSLVGEQNSPQLKTTEVDRPKSFISSSCDYFRSINIMLHTHMCTHICVSHHMCCFFSQRDSMLLL